MSTQGQILKNLVQMEADELLHSVGLERRGSAFTRWSSTLGTVAFGAALGAGLTWLYTTRKGASVRRKIEHGAQRLGETAAEFGDRMMTDAEVSTPASMPSKPSPQPKH